MDHQQTKRPQRSAATRPKTYVHSHATRKASHNTLVRSPPNSNIQQPASPAQRTAAGPPMTPPQSTDQPASSAAGPPAPPPDAIDRETSEAELELFAIDESDMAAEPTEPATLPNQQVNPMPPNLEAYFKSATASFEKMIKSAVDSFIAKLGQMEESLGASIEFERKRIDDLKEKQGKFEERMEKMEKELQELRLEVSRNTVANNQSERLSRRNNIRFIGIEEATPGERENCAEIVEEILRSKFAAPTKVERAHRDGKKVDGRPRHILVKFLSYRDKVDIMRRARDTLKTERYFIVDDLTQTDLKEKKKWNKQVQDLYKDGTKLRFYAGKWRQTGGIPFNFE